MKQKIELSDVVDCLFEYLQSQSSSVGEHQIIQHLSQRHFFTSLDECSASLKLFKKHFLTMHALYLLQNKLKGSGQGLTISPLTVQLYHLEQQLSQELASENPRISDYYLDLKNLDEATEETVEELLTSFWSRFAVWQSGDDAFLVLGLSETATWSEVQKAYRRKAQLEHPDKGGCSQKFTEYSDAYQKLKNYFGA